MDITTRPQKSPMSQACTDIIMAQPRNTTSSANTTTSTCIPTKEQGIRVNFIDGTDLSDYRNALDVPDESIIFMDISEGSVNVYMDTKERACNLVSKSIKVKNKDLIITPPIIRIVLLDVSPVIPNAVIEKKFDELNVRILSPIAFMKLDITDPRLAHVLSFSRQLYISIHDVARLPKSIYLTFEGTNYFTQIVSVVGPSVTKSHLTHMFQKNLPNLQNTNNNSDQKQNTDSELAQKRLQIDVQLTSSTRPDQPTSSQIEIKARKRHSPSLEFNRNENDSDEIDIKPDRTVLDAAVKDIYDSREKKQKKLLTSTDEEVWKYIEANMAKLSKGKNFPVSLKDFKIMLEKARGPENINNILTLFKCNTQLDELKSMCITLHSCMNCGLQNRCSRFFKRLSDILVHQNINSI